MGPPGVVMRDDPAPSEAMTTAELTRMRTDLNVSFRTEAIAP